MRGIGLAAMLCLAAVPTEPAAAQDSTRVVPAVVSRDTLPFDTIGPGPLTPDTLLVPIPPDAVAGDTIPSRPEVADSLREAPVYPAYPAPRPAGWAVSRWEWGRDELLRFHGLSLLELVERLPGLVPVRSGGFGRPAGLSTLGLGGGRLRVILDGFELEPLDVSAADLQRIGLTGLDRVVVERTLSGIRVELTSFRLDDARPYSLVEAGTGNYNAKILRALFSRPLGERSVVTGSFGLMNTDGYGRNEPFGLTQASVRWNYALGPETAVEAEYRRSGLERESADETFAANASRTDLVVRARGRPLPRLVVEGVLGRSQHDPGETDTFAGRTLRSTSAALRAGYDLGIGWVEAGMRTGLGERTGFVVPDTEMSARASLLALPWLLVEGAAATTTLDGARGSELSGTVRAGPWGGWSLFGTLSSGERGLGFGRDTLLLVEQPPDSAGTVVVDSVTRLAFPSVQSTASGLRAGAEWSQAGVRAGAAYLALGDGAVVPFGTPFDVSMEPVSVGAATGFEVFASVPLLLPGLRAEGWYQRWSDVGRRPYLPTEFGRAALVYHRTFYQDELEPSLRVEALRRGSSLVPGGDGEPGFSAVAAPYTLFNLHLQIRIQAVRAFLVWENLAGTLNTGDLADLPLPGARIVYGVRWYFLN